MIKILFIWEKSIMTSHAAIMPEQPDLKKQAETILQELGIPLSVAYDLFYRQIVTYRGLPFEIRLPNQTTILSGIIYYVIGKKKPDFSGLY